MNLLDVSYFEQQLRGRPRRITAHHRRIYTRNAYITTYMRVSAKRSYCIHNVGRGTREKERKTQRSSIDWSVAWWNVAAILGVYEPRYIRFSLRHFPFRPSLFLSLPHSISLPLVRLAFTLAMILPCSKTQARHMDPGTINTRFPNQTQSLSFSLIHSISLSLIFFLLASPFPFPSLSSSVTIPSLC